jgi:hypothetical protein
MTYTRGWKDDWDKRAKVRGEEELSWNRMLSYMLKVGTVTISLTWSSKDILIR